MKRVSVALMLLAVFFLLAATTARSETYITKTFPVGTAVIPMDDQQADKLRALGLAHALLSDGMTVYRIVAPPDPVLDVTGESSSTFFGGPLLAEGVIPAAILSQFPSVTIKYLDAAATSSRVFKTTLATSILVVYGEFAQTGNLLNNMGIPYTEVTRATVEATPEVLVDFDVVVIDCPGWNGNGATDALKQAFRNYVYNGGELIFNDIALQTLNAVFPGYVNVTYNNSGEYNFTFHQQGDFISQFYNDGPVAVETHAGGTIADAVLDPSVKVLLDAPDYGAWYPYLPGRYAIAAFYFPFGKGYVEGFAYHPHDQPSQEQQLNAVFYGNKIVHLIPPQTGRMTGGGTICQTTKSSSSTKGLNCGDTSCKKTATHGFTLHCDAYNLPNNLEVNWSYGKKFHMTKLLTAMCSDNPSIKQRPPRAWFDTIEGTGEGRYNNVDGATIVFKFTDAGEPGTKDFADITITDKNGNVVLDIAGYLNKGNQQAHNSN